MRRTKEEVLVYPIHVRRAGLNQRHHTGESSRLPSALLQGQKSWMCCPKRLTLDEIVFSFCCFVLLLLRYVLLCGTMPMITMTGKRAGKRSAEEYADYDGDNKVVRNNEVAEDENRS